MPKLLVKLPDRTVVYHLVGGENLVGRDDGCGLRLPHGSVSRTHCCVQVDRQNALLKDLESQNGVLVNGKLQKEHVLKSGDELQIGVVSVVYLGDASKDRFYKGRYVDYLPTYDPEHLSEVDDGTATRVLGIGSMLKMQQGNHLIENARIISLENNEAYWYPMDKKISFGNEGMVRVEGWFTWGVVAEVAWDGTRHVLQQKSWWVPCTVNNQGVSKMPLSHGARFTVGNSRFRYDAPPLKGS